MQINNKILATIFFVLLGIWIIRKTSCKPSQRSFRSHITIIDTSSVDKIILWPKGENGERVELLKDGEWTASDGTRTVQADQSRVNSILGQLVNIPVKQLISNNPDRQQDYEVDMASGKIIEVYSGDQLIDKLIIGRFNFNQQTRSGVSYTRKDGEDDIYSVEGFISMSFDTDFNSFRPKELLKLNPQDLKSITLSLSGQSLNIQKQSDNNWTANGTQLDSTLISQYVSGLGNVEGTAFYDNVLPAGPGNQSATFRGDNMVDGITIEAWTNTGEGDPFLIRSSLNPAMFTSDSTGVYDRIFGKLGEMIKF